MKIAGIVLLVIEAFGILMGIVNGTLVNMISSAVTSPVYFISYMIGFLLPGIIGAVLLIFGIKRAKRK